MSPKPETEVAIEFKVVIRNYGHNDDTMLTRLATSLARGLFRTFDNNFDLFLADGRRVVFDHLADDGHHPGHDHALVVEPAG